MLLGNALVAAAALDREVPLRGRHLRHQECLVERVDGHAHRLNRQLALGGERAVEAEVELAVIAVEEEGRLVDRRDLAAVTARATVAHRQMDLLAERAVAMSAEVQCEVVARNMLVGFAAWCDPELEVMNALLQVLHTVVRLLLEVGVVDAAEIATASLTLDLELRALQIVVISLMLRKNPDAAAVGTRFELFRAFADMAQGLIVIGFVRAGLVGAFKR